MLQTESVVHSVPALAWYTVVYWQGLVKRKHHSDILTANFPPTSCIVFMCYGTTITLWSRIGWGPILLFISCSYSSLKFDEFLGKIYFYYFYFFYCYIFLLPFSVCFKIFDGNNDGVLSSEEIRLMAQCMIRARLSANQSSSPRQGTNQGVTQSQINEQTGIITLNGVFFIF